MATFQPGRGPLTRILPVISCTSSLSGRGRVRRLLKFTHRQRNTPDREPQMITFFFAFVMVTTFVAVAAGVAESVLSTRTFA